MRPELEPLPERMLKLPIRRGYPVPWFVEWLEDAKHEEEPPIRCPIGEGTAEFRLMNDQRRYQAMHDDRCWICGGKLASFRAFALGPVSTITRTTAEPPGHIECIEWSIRNCPFLARPWAHRRGEDDEVMTNSAFPSPEAIRQNPGIAVLWISHRSQQKVFRGTGGGDLLRIGTPDRVSWWTESRLATRDEVLRAIAEARAMMLEEAADKGWGPVQQNRYEEGLLDLIGQVGRWVPDE